MHAVHVWSDSMLARRIRHALNATICAAGLALPSTGGSQLASPNRQPLSGPQSSGAPQFRLGDVYAALGQSNPKIAAARALADAARARIPVSKVPPDPQLQLGFMNYGLPGLRPMDPLGMPQLQLMQMVPTAGKLGHAGRIATRQAAAQRERAGEVQWEVRSSAAMAYYELYASEHSLLVARETRRLLEDITRLAETMYEVGEGRQADVLRAQVEVARMTEEITRMEAMRAGAAARLAALLDRGDSLPGAAALPRFPEAVVPLDSILALALRNRPMLRAGEREVEAADAAVRLARSEVWPDLVLGLQYAQRRAEMGIERMGSLMIGASIPVFVGRRQRPMREEAAAMRAMAEADLRSMRADTRGRVGEVYATLSRARSLARLYTTTVLPQAEAAAASALAAYRVGRVDFMTLLDDRMTVNTYRQELIALQAEEGRAWAELEMLTGFQLMDPYALAAAKEDNQ